ncbi:sensor histidine kinase [Corynebacterium sp. NPDC060344]|uniref:sensor histidine kinase n=1 Tax=Corynebacterium sp. NPDC060344 TaxID=3347101 RepID=UPI00365C8536
MTDAADSTDAAAREAAPSPHTSTHTDSRTSRSVPRGAGQLPGAAPDRPRGTISGGVRASWWYSLSGLVMLIATGHALLLLPAFVAGGTDVARAVLIAVTCAVSAGVQLSFAPGLRDGLGSGVRTWPVPAAMLVLGAAILAIAAPLQWSSLPLITAISLLACRAGGRWWWAAIAVSAAAIAIERMAAPDDAGSLPGSIILHVFFPPMIWATAWSWDVIRRTDHARATESRLAVARERLRFAADLHDIQGHTLQVIALKAELAERLLPDDPTATPAPDPSRIAAARAQIAEIRALAADAMADTRELVQGYRAPELEEELANARDVLAAADFRCTVDAAELPAAPAARAIFGRVLREATTNVLRHGAPGPVDITIARAAAPGAWLLRIGNDAPAGDGPSPSKNGGSGLAGLRERLAEAGGTLAVLDDVPASPPPGHTRRFTVTATVPADTGTTPGTGTDQEVSR